MDILQTIIMGIVQGLSEFLPISSSAHLVFSSNFYKIIKGAEIIQNTNQEVFLDIMLHIGTLIAVLIYFRKDIKEIILGFFSGLKSGDWENKDFKMSIYIIWGTLMTVCVAYPLFRVAQWLVFKPEYTAILLIFTGAILLSSEHISKKLNSGKNISLKNSILIGIAQGFASLPGFSRSGLTIATGLFSGVSRTESARYSFLLSIPIILGASVAYPLLTIDFNEVITYNWTAITIGTIVSGIVGYLCIKYFLKFLSKFSLNIFGYYCIIMGVFASIFFFIK